MYTTLAIIKNHLNITPEFEEDDEYLLYLYEVAEAAVQVNLCVNIKDLEDDNGKIPAPVIHAMLLYIGEMYNNREINAFGVSVSPTSHNFDFLISLYKNYSDTTSDKFYREVLDSVIERLEIDKATGKLILHENPNYYTGIREKAQKRIEDGLLVNGGHLYLERNGI